MKLDVPYETAIRAASALRTLADDKFLSETSRYQYQIAYEEFMKSVENAIQYETETA
jgi:hypothetical protein